MLHARTTAAARRGVGVQPVFGFHAAQPKHGFVTTNVRGRVERHLKNRTGRRPSLAETAAEKRHRDVARRYRAADSGAESAEGTRAVASGCQPGLVSIAVDATDASRLAVAWAVDQLICAGDGVRLVHVLCNDREAATAVGTSATGRLSFQPPNVTASLDTEDNLRELGSRLHQRADDIVLHHMVPLLAGNGVSYEVSYPEYPGAKSAAVVGGIICRDAAEAGAKVLVVASHGPGIMAAFGSVARYCFSHAPVPLVVLPPATLGVDPQAEGWPPGPLVVAVAHQQQLDAALEWVRSNVLQPGDTVEVLHTSANAEMALKLPATYPAPVCIRRLDPAATCTGAEGAEQQQRELEDGLGSFAAADARNEVGIALVEAAEQLAARLLVVPYDVAANEVLAEMSSPSIASYAVRHSARPLLVVRG